MSKEDREKFDALLARFNELLLVDSLRREREAAELPAGRRPPPWWKGDEFAAQSSIVAAKQMGFQVMEQT